MEIFAYDEMITLTPAMNIDIYETPDSYDTTRQIGKEDVIVLEETDEKSWIKIKIFDTGETGYIRLEKRDNYSYSLYNQDVVDGILFYGMAPIGF